ncbi:MAG: hypothetical protein VW238_05025 [Nitrosomonadales bacterium]|jgi:hypothetical protein
MALKAITLRLDEEEYEQLKSHLEAFGDPDINVAYVVRSYIRDLNRSIPFLISSGWDLKNYFGALGSWLKQFGSMKDSDMFKMMTNPWAMWSQASQTTEDDLASDTDSKKNKKKS